MRDSQLEWQGYWAGNAASKHRRRECRGLRVGAGDCYRRAGCLDPGVRDRVAVRIITGRPGERDTGRALGHGRRTTRKGNRSVVDVLHRVVGSGRCREGGIRRRELEGECGGAEAAWELRCAEVSLETRSIADQDHRARTRDLRPGVSPPVAVTLEVYQAPL